MQFRVFFCLSARNCKNKEQEGYQQQRRRKCPILQECCTCARCCKNGLTYRNHRGFQVNLTGSRVRAYTAGPPGRSPGGRAL